MKIYNNNIAQRFLVLVLTLAMFSCDDYIEEKNYSNLTGEDFITEENADRLVTGIYSSLRELYKNYNTDLLGTDIFTTQGNINTDLNSLNVYVNINSGEGTFSTLWEDNYSTISKANIAINQYLNEISWTDSNLPARDNGVAQAKALRALAYYNLVQQFGGVVISLDEIKEISSDYTRATEEESFTQIIKDLEEAIPALEENPETGRFSKRAAQHLLAEVYLTKGYKSFGTATDYATAATLAEAAIGGYDIRNQSFEEVFDYDNQVNDEILFAVQYGAGGDYDDRNNNKHAILMNSVDAYPGMDRQNPYGFKDGSAMPTEFFYSLFDANDEREAATLHRVIYANVKDTVGIDPIAVGDTIVYYPKIALDATELAEKLDRYYVYQPDEHYFNDFPVDVSGANYLYTENVNQTNFPIFKKFDDIGFDEAEGGYRDTFIFRVAASHLIAAEAYIGAGNTASAMTHLNIVRERATGVANHYTTATIDDVLNERALELAGESSRWNVLKRTGKLEEKIKLHNPHVINNGAFDAAVHLLRPIPSSEIQLSGGNITQNPGY